MNVKKSKRKCSFQESWKAKFPFLKNLTSGQVYCTLCSSQFCVLNSGISDVNNHIKTKKHISSAIAKSNSCGLEKFIRTEPSNEEEIIAAKEAVFAFHAVNHDHSFRSMDCTTELIQTTFCKKFRCKRTKSEAIINNVIVPLSIEWLKQELETITFISVITDTSNHKSTKMVPIMIRFFHSKKGVLVRLLEVLSVPNETSNVMTDAIEKTLTKYEVIDKLIGFAADNCNTNFGGLDRNGQNNIFQQLKNRLDQNLFGIGCTAHIIHNACQKSCDVLPISIESIVVKLYNYFSIYTVRTEELKQICEEAAVKYKSIVKHSRTRFLSLLPAISTLIELFVPLKIYFLNLDDCPTILEEFFKNEMSLFWLYFLHNQLEKFNETTLLLEKSNVSATSAACILERFNQQLINRRNYEFIPTKSKNEMSRLYMNDSKKLKHQINRFYDTSIKYLSSWIKSTDGMNNFEWIELFSVPNFESIRSSIEFLKTKFYNIPKINEDSLLDEFSLIQPIISKNVEYWNENKLDCDNRWTQVFSFLHTKNINVENFYMLIQLVLCLPGTSASVERIFSIINKNWSPEKSGTKIETISAISICKTNINCSCKEFYNLLLEEKQFLKKIHSIEKYKLVK